MGTSHDLVKLSVCEASESDTSGVAPIDRMISNSEPYLKHVVLHFCIGIVAEVRNTAPRVWKVTDWISNRDLGRSQVTRQGTRTGQARQFRAERVSGSHGRFGGSRKEAPTRLRLRQGRFLPK